MSALNGAIAFAEPDALTVLVGQDLHFDVTRPLDGAFEVHGGVAERRASLARRLAERRFEVGWLGHHAQALAAAAGHGLERDREADRMRRAAHVVEGGERFEGARDNRDPGGLHQFAGLSLEPQGAHCPRRRANEDQARVDARLRKVGILGQKTVAGMHGVCAREARGFQDAVDAQIAVGGRCRADRIRGVGHPHVERVDVGVRIHRYRRDPHLATGADHPHRDFAPIGDQKSSYQGSSQESKLRGHAPIRPFFFGGKVRRRRNLEGHACGFWASRARSCRSRSRRWWSRPCVRPSSSSRRAPTSRRRSSSTRPPWPTRMRSSSRRT